MEGHSHGVLKCVNGDVLQLKLKCEWKEGIAPHNAVVKYTRVNGMMVIACSWPRH